MAYVIMNTRADAQLVTQNLFAISFPLATSNSPPDTSKYQYGLVDHPTNGQTALIVPEDGGFRVNPLIPDRLLDPVFGPPSRAFFATMADLLTQNRQGFLRVIINETHIPNTQFLSFVNQVPVVSALPNGWL